MAHPRSLVPGNCYFHVVFYDNHLLFPNISTLEYVGEGADAAGVGLWLFREPRSVDDSSDPSGSSDEDSLVGFSAEQLYQILDFAALSAVIGEVAVDHPLNSPVTVAAPLRAACADFGDLSERVATFLDSPNYHSVTMTVQFTDNGVSLGRRRDGGFAMGFFPHPRREPLEESKIRGLFASLGIRPHVDYLSNRGRTRILKFPVPDQRELLTQLCKRVLVEVYDMKEGDTLRFHFLDETSA
jgi:hypothetical protein